MGEETLATKGKKSPAKQTDEATVTRVKAAAGTKPAKKEKKTAPDKVAAPAETGDKKRRNPLRATGGYFAGAWYELKQVRWPNRRATWGMSAALLGFTAFFVVVILLLDAAFKYLFDVMLG